MRLFKLLPLLLFSHLALAAGMDIGATSQPNFESTYSAGAAAFSPPATPTDLCTITGVAGKTIRVVRVEISATQTTGAIDTFYLVKRSSADTGGTHAVTFTAVSHDSAQGSAVAAPQAYTANPGALGTLVGIIRVLNVLVPAPGATQATPGQSWDFDGPGANVFKPIMLRGTTEQLAVNFNGAALPAGLSVNCNFEWTEF